MAEYKGKTIQTAKGISHAGSFLLEPGEAFAVERTEVARGMIDADRMCIDHAKVFVVFRQGSGYVKHGVRLSNEPIEGTGDKLLREAFNAGAATFHNTGKGKVHVKIEITASRRE